MVVAVDRVARRYLDVSAGTPISVDYPAFEASDIRVYYGNDSLLAVENTDYTVALAGDFETFTVTPTASLISKINELIEFDATEANAITVRRKLDLLTPTTPEQVRYTPFTSREFDRTAMRLQQIEDASDRSIRLAEKFATPYRSVSIVDVPEADDLDDRALIWKAESGGLGVGPTVDEIASAQEYAEIAQQYATELFQPTLYSRYYSREKEINNSEWTSIGIVKIRLLLGLRTRLTLSCSVAGYGRASMNVKFVRQGSAKASIFRHVDTSFKGNLVHREVRGTHNGEGSGQTTFRLFAKLSDSTLKRPKNRALISNRLISAIQLKD